jgi:hypothetical protein
VAICAMKGLVQEIMTFDHADLFRVTVTMEA